MEVCVSHKSDCLDISSCIGSAADPQNPIQYSTGELSLRDLKTCLTELVIIEDRKILNSGFEPSPNKIDLNNEVSKYGNIGLDKITFDDSASDKCLSKSATFPPPGLKSSEALLSGDTGKHEEDIHAEASELNRCTKTSDQCYSRSISLPIPSKLVSAIKGSREKHGIPPKKLSVSWAPDVYDPIPTSVSHVPSNRSQRNLIYGKKSGKHKHKGRSKSSQGSSKGKEKKQSRRTGRSSGKFVPFHEIAGVDSFGEPRPGSVGFDAGSPELFCGSSFLKTSVGKLHFPVAEAT